MASIEVYDITDTSFSVRLIDLQTDVDYTRRVDWYVLSINKGTERARSYITAGDEQGGDFDFNDYFPNEPITLQCFVYRMDTHERIASLGIEEFYMMSDSWWVSRHSLDILQGDYDEEVMFKKTYRTHCYVLTFSKAGTAIFYTTGGLDTVCYLTEDDEQWNKTTGTPINPVASDDDSGEDVNFKISYEVDNETTYYLWVTTYKGSEIGTCYLHIDHLSEDTVDKPQSWAWAQDYELSTGGTGTICPDAYIPWDETGFHPVTAVDWNNFTDRINAVREYLAQYYSEFSTEYDFTFVYGASNGYSNNPTDFTAEIYNEAANAITALSNYAGLAYDIFEIDSGQEVTASLFTNLSGQLNFLIENL